MPENVTIIGDGAMGTVCAILLAENAHRVRLWSAFPEAAAKLASARENRRFLPGVRLPECVEVTGADDGVFADAAIAVSAVPTQFMREVWRRLTPHLPQAGPPLAICSVAKGIENGTLLRPTGIISDVLDGGDESGRPVAAISGPCIAPEVARKLPASVAVASRPDEFARRVQELFNRPYFRVYTNPDLPGVELAGATKNVIAIAAGVLDGMKAGDNAKAALMSRGLAEITRLGLTMGARRETFSGLAGLGDLVTTCISPVGRNRSFGEAVGKGSTVSEALGATDSVVEGVATTAGVVALAGRASVEMPITQAVHRVLEGDLSPTDAVAALMSRPLKAEA